MHERTFKRMELAKTGTFGAVGGTINRQDLQDVVDTFQKPVPVALGHLMARQDWWPSFGEVDTVELRDDPDGGTTLVGDCEFPEEVAQAIDERFYPGWSVSIPARAADGKRYLHHLALLGAVPAAIKNMKVLQSLGEGKKPEDAMVAGGTEFSDNFMYNFSDFPKAKEPDAPAKTTPAPAGGDGKTDKESAKDDGKDKGTGKDPAPAEEPKAEGKENAGTDGKAAPDTIVTKEHDDAQKEFSDDLHRKEKRARKALRDVAKERVVQAMDGRFPKGMQGLDEFADRIADDASAQQYEFSDGDEGKKPTLVDLFVSIVGTLPKRDKTLGDMQFSDQEDGRGKAPDTSLMASKF